MLDHFNRHRPRRRPGGCRSKLEEKVGHDFDQLQLQHSYEPDKFEYQLTRRYTPDFKVECEHPFYVEVKGWWQAEDRNKFLAVVLSNPDLPIFVALQRPFQTISKTSKTTYAAWCARWGIRWTPIPISKEFLMRWANGERCTSPVPSATAAMPPASTRKGWLHCFSCGAHMKVDAPQTSVGEEHELLSKLTGNAPTVDVGTQPQLVQAEHSDIEAWRITQRTCEEFGYRVTDLKHYADFRDEHGLVVCQHIRTLNPKGFRWLGRRTGVKPQLFGQHLGSRGHLVIAEGEKDAMCIYEALTRRERYEHVVVSVPDGAQSAHNSIKEQLTWIGGFNKVTIFFDCRRARAQGSREVCPDHWPEGPCRHSPRPLQGRRRDAHRRR